MPKPHGSKDSASKRTLNPTGPQAQPPEAHEQVQREGQPPQDGRKVGQYSGRGVPPLQKK